MPTSDDPLQTDLTASKTAHRETQNMRIPTEQEIDAAINMVPARCQSAVRRAATVTGAVARGTAQWARKKYEAFTTELLPPPEPTHTWRREPSPDQSEMSSYDGEEEIFPPKRRVSPSSRPRVKVDLEEAMRDSFPRPLGSYANGMEPGRGRRRNADARGRRESDVVVAQDVGTSKAWKKDMTAEEKRRRRELEREWGKKEERCRHEEENKAMDDVGEMMFRPTLELEMHSQQPGGEELPIERSSRWEERLSFITQPVQGISRGRQLEKGSSRVERSTRLRTERRIPLYAEESTLTRRPNALDRLEPSSQRNESRQNSKNGDGFENQALRGRAADENAPAQTGTFRQRREPENIIDLATSIVEMIRQNNMPKMTEQPRQPEKTQKKEAEQAEDSSSDDTFPWPR